MRLVVVIVEDGDGCVYGDDDGGRRNKVWWENRERIAHTQGREEEEGVGYLQNYPFFKVKMSELSMVSVLCQKTCVCLSLL